MKHNYFIPGEWNAICDSCGRKFKASQLQKRWDGFMVCSEDWEPRHIADFIKAPNPEKAIPWSRPESADREIVVPYVNDGTQDTTIPVVTPGNAGGL